MNYSYKHCNFTTASITAFVSHLSIHRNLANFRFPCGVAKCFATFVTRGAVQSHMYRFHKKTAKPGLKRKIDGVDLACSVEGCNCQQIFQAYMNIFIGILKMAQKCHALKH